ncbi:g-protein coupled receptor 157 [Anaeramoeba ignava]|uniref:G-protein coupled receptor 157 n=1 Tax=Anaeramoeba ignava TaxID=1746090 RepID=A0A9Q0LZ41_ANAIG|nr:g-protein coupled receptor 157 [Anaeramoeba ignava]
MKGEDISAIVGSSLGVIGALIIIIIFLYFKEYSLFYRKLVFILSIYDFFQSFSYLLPGHSNQVLCKIQYYLLAVSATTTSFWSAAISFISYLKVVKGFNDKKLNKIHKWFHLIMLIPIIVFVSIVSVTRDYESSKTHWCFSTAEPFIITVYAFIWTFIFICLIFYILTMKFLRKIFKVVSSEYSHQSQTNQMNQVWVQIRMSLIPLVYIIVEIPATIRRLREVIKPSSSENFTLDVFHSLLATSQGFWDFWIFIVFDPEMREKLKHSCCSTSQKYFQANPDFDLQTYDTSIKKNLLSINDSFEIESKNSKPLFDFGNQNQNQNHKN